MATFTAGSALDALKVQLDARGGMSGVTVATGPLGSETPREAITFNDVESNEQHASMGQAQETYDLLGNVYIEKAGQGEAIIKSARDRAIAILKELKDQLDDDETINSTVTTARFSSYEMSQVAVDPPARVCSIDFRVEVVALDVE